jgi:uncharacterized protein YlaI
MQQPCSNCRSADVVDVQISLRDGAVRFYHCRSCEHRWWTDTEQESVIELGDVLGKVGTR